MFLKGLDVCGFKSFADRTNLDFTSGVTALVGPNGCGKSNVVDAIRWALGEQSAKSLRGSEMTDLIFNGTVNRRPMGFAQVSLAFDNSKRNLPVDTDEVAVTRRLYRTGESEYLINGQPSRLRDIRDLFMDTGVGVGAYSIIEQGKVDALLQASAKERRGIFEEAAGIAKYRSRKAAALRKLERVDQHLLRVGDVMTEVDRQLRSVVRQAAKARRYRQLADELAQVRLTVLAADCRALGEKLSGLRAELSAGQDQLAKMTAESARLEAEITEAQARATELEQSSAAAEQRRAEDRARLVKLEAEIAAAEGLVERHAEEAKRAIREAEELAERAAAAERDERAAREERERAELERAELSARVAAAESSASEGATRAAELSESIERRKAEVFEVMRQRAGADTEAAGLLAEMGRLGAELGRLEQRLGVLGEKAAAAERETEMARQRITDISARRIAVAGEIDRSRVDEAAAATALEALDQRWAELSYDISGTESHLALLREQEARQEGLNRGVKGILAAMSAGSAPAGMCGIVADLVTVPAEFEVAIETALGPKVQNVVTVSTQAAREAVELLKREQLGRATFLPMDRVREGSFRPGPELLAEPGVIGRAVDLVSFAPEHRPVFEYLLGSTVVVQDLDAAMRIANNGARDGLVVTLDGDIFYPSGAITGGAYRTRIPGLISRRNEITRLEESLDDSRADLADMAARRAELVARRGAGRERIDRLAAEHNALQTGELRLREGLSLVAREATRFAEEHGLVGMEADALRARRSDAELKLQQMRERGQELLGAEQAMEREIADMQERLRGAERERAGLRERLTGLRVETAHLEEKCASLTGRAESAARLLQERQAEAADRRAAAERARAASEAELRRAGELRAQVGEAVAAAEQADRAGSELSARRAELREAIVRAQSAERSGRTELNAVAERVSATRLAEREATMRLENVLEKARGLGEEDLPARSAALSPETLDMGHLRAKAEEGEAKLAKMGEVNLAAIGEEDALRARLEELQVQKSDLETARGMLRDAIGRINRISRERFTATFELVRQHFGEIYRKLFAGGNADIRLEEEDVLESGIEVIARPPGKEPQRLSLLSGGERALTTIALLFAIFKAKPSPFCILDEVDAPLDESNIDRFMMVLREFLDRSQFLIITHNRRTMATADTIYGVTMQESGVSKRIAVRFEEVGEELEVA